MAGPSAFSGAGAAPAAAAQPSLDGGSGGPGADATPAAFVRSYDTAPGMAGAAGHSIYEPPPPGARVVPGVQHHSHLPGPMSVSRELEGAMGWWHHGRANQFDWLRPEEWSLLDSTA